jgi:deazaflavin-dependent oxidoreductase (nitroreductase family)
MARTYRLSLSRRAANAAIRPLIRLGLAGPHTFLLTVRGRLSGRRHSTPVRLVESANERWLVAPYGETSWVKNARAAGRVELARGGRSERLAIAELAPEGRAAVLREYVREVPVVRPFFDAGPGAPLEAFAAEAERHPVFRLIDKESPNA